MFQKYLDIVTQDRVLASIAAGIFMIATAVLATLLFILISNSHYNCLQLNHLKAGTTTQLEITSNRLRTVESFLKKHPNAPSGDLLVRYYRARPDKLAEDLRENQKLLETYRPSDCSILFHSH